MIQLRNSKFENCKNNHGINDETLFILSFEHNIRSGLRTVQSLGQGFESGNQDIWMSSDFTVRNDRFDRQVYFVIKRFSHFEFSECLKWRF